VPAWKKILTALLVLLASCAGGDGPLREVAVWEDPATGAAAAFYHADPGLPEDRIREAAKVEGRRLLEGSPSAALYIFFDVERAWEVHAETYRTSTPPPFGPATLLGGRNLPGGAILQWDAEGGRRNWVYVPPQPSATGS